MNKSTLQNAYEQFLNAGFILQRTAKFTKHAWKRRAYANRDNDTFNINASGYVAIVPRGVISLDIDVGNGKVGLESYKSFLELSQLPYEPIPTTLTQSGGFHVYFENPYPDLVIGTEAKKKFPNLDMFSSFQTVHPIAGTQYKNADNELKSYEWYPDSLGELIINPWNENLKELLGLCERGSTNKEEFTDDDPEIQGFWDMVVEKEKETKMPDDDVHRLILELPLNIHYDDWLAAGMSLYDRYGGSQEGFEIFDAFSKRSSEKYDYDYGHDKWFSGALRSNKITFNHLKRLVNDYKVINYIQNIKEATTADELENIADEIKENGSLETRRNKYSSDTIKELAEIWRTKLKDIEPNSHKLHLGTSIKRLTKEVLELRVENDELDEVFGWIDNIVYVDSFKGNKYYVLSSGARYSAEGFGMKYGTLIKKSCRALGMKNVSLNGLMNSEYGCKTCIDHCYNPTTNEKVYEHNGEFILNLFDKDSRPPIATHITPKGQNLIDSLVNHLKYITSDEESETLLDWMAWMAQNFGKKLLWSPLLQSTEGIGKSVIGNILINHVFGKKNSGTADCTVVVSRETSWATNSVFKVLEEIRLAGHNRYEVLNQLKPLITNTTISRVEKYEVSSTVDNYCNFIAFTNYTDALPIEKGDRRWWIVFSSVNSIEDLEKKTGIDKHTYFAPLYALSNCQSPYGAEFHKWLMDRDVSRFISAFPPDSLHKESMIATEENSSEFLTELRELIEHGYKGVSKELLSTKMLKTAFDCAEEDGVAIWQSVEKPNDKALGVLLKKLGFIKVPTRTPYNKELHYLWTTLKGKSKAVIDKKFKEMMDEDEL